MVFQMIVTLIYQYKIKRTIIIHGLDVNNNDK